MSEQRLSKSEVERVAVSPVSLFDAAWAALMTGRHQELTHLQELLERPLDTSGSAAQAGPDQLLRLQHLLAATARNLRMLRGQHRSYSF